jgi:hypothetical protein
MQRGATLRNYYYNYVVVVDVVHHLPRPRLRAFSSSFFLKEFSSFKFHLFLLFVLALGTLLCTQYLPLDHGAIA